MLHLDRRVPIGAQEYRITDFLADDEGRLGVELTPFPSADLTDEQLEDWDAPPSVLAVVEVAEEVVVIVPLWNDETSEDFAAHLVPASSLLDQQLDFFRALRGLRVGDLTDRE
jgi:hypothetical protein